MAEEKQEDMSMDEILSSIKNILSDGTEEQVSEPEEVSENVDDASIINIEVPDTSSVDLALDDTDDGVLDLTEDMRVSAPILDTTPTFDASITDDTIDININDELSEVSVEIPDADIDETYNTPIVSSVSEDISSDPIYSPEEDDLSQPLYNADEEILSDTPDILSTSNDFAVDNIPEPEVYAQEEYIEQSMSEPTDNENDATDVSANIINNFAKIFSSNQETNIEETPKVASSVKLGADATLSDMVKATIRDMIAEDMIHNIVSQTDIKALTSQEVASQVKIWLNDNLPSMVENIVKKEIERVMVKAGKN